ncbi:Hypothetical protein CAP_3499 [Chondromyces apiculatus DSM 436]|uniref:Uncharacterized protein n=1 Tax=Chondromyces apiculatus DSM 436 TaxID=1192034 RepID=A0A017T7D6_9BACT|nr:Hypothetical protein CAP_3499 [Chondromyces apiculatus DSM 436]
MAPRSPLNGKPGSSAGAAVVPPPGAPSFPACTRLPPAGAQR